MKHLAIIIVLLLHGMASMAQYDVVYDSTFGTDGTIILPYEIITRKGLFIQSDGKMVLLTNKKLNNGLKEFTTIRLNTDGTLDLTYNNSGFNNSPTSFDSDPFMCGLLLPNHDLIVAGTEPYLNNWNKQSIFLHKYLENGKKDSLFGNGGVLTITEDSMHLFCRDILRYNDTSLLILYNRIPFPNSPNQPSIVLCKVKLNGVLDSSFAENGKLIQPLKPYPDARIMSLRDDGAIFISLNNLAPSSYFDKIVKLNPDLTVDTGFDFQLDPPYYSVFNISFDDDGKMIIIASRAEYGYNVWRFMPDGTPDYTFSRDGLHSGHLNFTTGNPEQYILQPDGKILLAISAGAIAIRLNPNGTLDYSFDLDGVVELIPVWEDVGLISYRATGMTLLPDGKMLFVTETDTDQIKIIQVKTRP